MLSVKNVFSYIRRDNAYARLIKPCISACEDNLSRSILKTRINYYSEFYPKYQRYIPFYKAPYLRFHHRINRLINPLYRIEELDAFWGKRLVLLGEGDDFDYTMSLLKRSKWKDCFRSIGNDIELVYTIKDDEILIPTKLSGLDGYIEEIRKINSNVRIYRPNGSLLWALTGNQYFDVYSARENEVVVDCGAYDGQTEVEICKWGGNRIKKIYAFELDPYNKDLCINCYKDQGIESVVEFINKGTSNQNGEISLGSSTVGTTASCIGEGDQKAEVVRIDDVISDDVTFIKMDIEGAELDALKGAELTIKRCKPRLAICVYHKQSDIYDIPNYLLSIVPDYKFKVRHYSSNPWETVLYASTNN